MKGFTLIEVMITVAIVGILAAIAYPSYLEHVYRSRRVDAQGTLMDLAQWMERNYTTALKYNEDSQGNGIGDESLKAKAKIQNPNILTYYTFTFTNLAGNAFTLSATPKMAQVNDKCGTLTLDNLGQKGVSNLSVQECW